MPHDLERAVLERLGRQLGEPLARLGLGGQPEQDGEIREPLVGFLAGRVRERAAEREPRAQLRIVERDTEPVAQQVAERPIGRRLAV